MHERKNDWQYGERGRKIFSFEILRNNYIFRFIILKGLLFKRFIILNVIVTEWPQYDQGFKLSKLSNQCYIPHYVILPTQELL